MYGAFGSGSACVVSGEWRVLALLVGALGGCTGAATSSAIQTCGERTVVDCERSPGCSVRVGRRWVDEGGCWQPTGEGPAWCGPVQWCPTGGDTDPTTLYVDLEETALFETSSACVTGRRDEAWRSLDAEAFRFCPTEAVIPPGSTWSGSVEVDGVVSTLSITPSGWSGRVLPATLSWSLGDEWSLDAVEVGCAVSWLPDEGQGGAVDCQGEFRWSSGATGSTETIGLRVSSTLESDQPIDLWPVTLATTRYGAGSGQPNQRYDFLLTREEGP